MSIEPDPTRDNPVSAKIRHFLDVLAHEGADTSKCADIVLRALASVAVNAVSDPGADDDDAPSLIAYPAGEFRSGGSELTISAAPDKLTLAIPSTSLDGELDLFQIDVNGVKKEILPYAPQQLEVPECQELSERLGAYAKS